MKDNKKTNRLFELLVRFHDRQKQHEKIENVDHNQAIAKEFPRKYDHRRKESQGRYHHGHHQTKRFAKVASTRTELDDQQVQMNHMVVQIFSQIFIRSVVHSIEVEGESLYSGVHQTYVQQIECERSYRNIEADHHRHEADHNGRASKAGDLFESVATIHQKVHANQIIAVRTESIRVNEELANS